MAYTSKNFKTKKAVKLAIAAGEKITCYQPGPHYPQPHRWYGQGKLKDGYLVSIK